MLVSDAGSQNEGLGNYFASSWSENTVQVDGYGQNRFAVPRQSAFSRPIRYRWHSSPGIDFAEGEYEYGYGRIPDPEKPDLNYNYYGRGAMVNEVSHERMLVFLRGPGVWVVIDELDAPSGSEHRYTQTWNFDYRYAPDEVLLDAGAGAISTAESGGPNVFLRHLGTPGLEYRSHYAEGYGEAPTTWPLRGSESSKERAVFHRFPHTARGWQNIGCGWNPVIHPAVDVHAEWSGTGPQRLVTLIAPSASPESPVLEVESRDADGADSEIRLAGGWTIRVVARDEAADLTLEGVPLQAAIVVAATGPNGAVDGIALGTESLGGEPSPTYDLAFALRSGTLAETTPIRKPKHFEWIRSSDGSWNPSYER
jgi:hypothetical protein